MYIITCILTFNQKKLFNSFLFFVNIHYFPKSVNFVFLTRALFLFSRKLLKYIVYLSLIYIQNWFWTEGSIQTKQSTEHIVRILFSIFQKENVIKNRREMEVVPSNNYDSSTNFLKIYFLLLNQKKNRKTKYSLRKKYW